MMLKRFIQAGLMCAAVWATTGHAAAQGEMPFGAVVLSYSIFNSTLLPAEMAQQYQLNRRADEVIVNISLRDAATKKPLAAQLDGYARNLIQKTKPLAFKEIKDATGIVYLAALRTTQREVFHFIVKVTPPKGETFTATFAHELFINP